MIDQTIPPNLREIAQRELQPGEWIQWIGMPRATFFTGDSVGRFLFGIPFTGFALFWTAAAAWGTMKDQKEPGFFILFPLWGIPFILVGCWMLLSPVWTYLKALRTIYVVTDQRAIICELGRSKTVRSYLPYQLAEIYRREKKDGSGDIVITQRGEADSSGSRRNWEDGFFRIPNVQTVEQLLKKLAEQSSRRNRLNEG